jgi:hypothetical protein
MFVSCLITDLALDRHGVSVSVEPGSGIGTRRH